MKIYQGQGQRCRPSYLGNQGRRIAKALEFRASLANTNDSAGGGGGGGEGTEHRDSQCPKGTKMASRHSGVKKAVESSRLDVRGQVYFSQRAEFLCYAQEEWTSVQPL